MSLRAPATRINENSVVVASRHQMSCQLADEVVLLHLDSGIYYGLKEVGFRIWEMLQEPVLVSAILERLQEDYEVSRETGREDVLAFLADLESRGLLELRA